MAEPERVNRPGDQPSDGLLDQVRRAIADPGKVVIRRREAAELGTVYESVSNWSARAVIASVISPLLTAKDAEIEQLRQDVIEESQHRDFLWWLYAEAAWKRDEAERERDVARVAAGSAYQRADDQTKATIDCLKKCQAAEGLAAQAGKAEELLTARVAELTRERDEARAFAEEWSRTRAAMPSPVEWNTVVRQRDGALAAEAALASKLGVALSGRPVAQEAGEPLDGRLTDADDYGQDYEAQAAAMGVPLPDSGAAQEAGEWLAQHRKAQQLRDAMDRWARDAPFRNGLKGATGCPIVLVAMAEQKTPAEWLDGPRDEHGRYSMADQYHCIEFRAPGDGGGEPKPKPEPPDMHGLFPRPERRTRMYVQPADAPDRVLEVAG